MPAKHYTVPAFRGDEDAHLDLLLHACHSHKCVTEVCCALCALLFVFRKSFGGEESMWRGEHRSSSNAPPSAMNLCGTLDMQPVQGHLATLLPESLTFVAPSQLATQAYVERPLVAFDFSDAPSLPSAASTARPASKRSPGASPKRKCQRQNQPAYRMASTTSSCGTSACPGFFSSPKPSELPVPLGLLSRVRA